MYNYFQIVRELRSIKDIDENTAKLRSIVATWVGYQMHCAGKKEIMDGKYISLCTFLEEPSCFLVKATSKGWVGLSDCGLSLSRQWTQLTSNSPVSFDYMIPDPADTISFIDDLDQILREVTSY